MPLYHVQDSDRPMFVIAANYQAAVKRWETLIALENECEPDGIEPPQGIAHVADDNDILIASDYMGKLFDKS